jgi:hypothetical protein
MGTSKQVFHALAGGAPNEILVCGQVGSSRGGVYAGGLASLDQFAADFVGHALKLGKGNLGFGTASVADSSGLLDRLCVVSGKNQVSCRIFTVAIESSIPLTGQDTSSNSVVACVGIGLGIKEALARIRSEISPTNELDAKRESLLLGRGKVTLQNGGCLLLVCLVCSIDGGSIGSRVVLLGKFNGPVIDAILQHVLLSVEQKTDTALVSKLADGINGLVQVRAGRKSVLELMESQTTSTSEPTKRLLAG